MSGAQLSGDTGHGQQQLLVSLGLAVLDDIHFGSGAVVKDELGGSATYCTVGARLFMTPAKANTLSWLIRAGEDFPTGIEAYIMALGIDLRVQKLPGRKSTRGLLLYEDTTFGPKTFQYATPVIEMTPKYLADANMLSSQYFHTLCPPDHIKSQVEELLELRSSQGLDRPFIIWEPSPPMCRPEMLQACFDSVVGVDVFSPNHLELLRLFGRSPEAFSRETTQELALRFLQVGVGPAGQGVVLVRAGEHGCLVAVAGRTLVWLPPFYEPEKGTPASKSKIVDTTGAGNAFLGGFAVGHSETGDFVTAAHYGSVAASFVVEQIGVPKLDETVSATKDETWNGENPRERLQIYQERLKS